MHTVYSEISIRLVTALWATTRWLLIYCARPGFVDWRLLCSGCCHSAIAEEFTLEAEYRTLTCSASVRRSAERRSAAAVGGFAQWPHVRNSCRAMARRITGIRESRYGSSTKSSGRHTSYGFHQTAVRWGRY